MCLLFLKKSHLRDILCIKLLPLSKCLWCFISYYEYVFSLLYHLLTYEDNVKPYKNLCNAKMSTDYYLVIASVSNGNCW